MDESGRFPTLMKLAGLGGTPKAFTNPGVEKSSIWSFRIIPVFSEMK